MSDQIALIGLLIALFLLLKNREECSHVEVVIGSVAVQYSFGVTGRNINAHLFGRRLCFIGYC